MIRYFISLSIALLSILPAYASQPKQLHLFVVGTGVVGSKLLDLIDTQEQFYREQYGLNIRIVALANSRFMAVEPSGISLNSWQTKLTQSEQPMSWEAFKQNMVEAALPHSVFVDCSSSQEISDSYAELLESGIAIVTPNKKANSSTMASYQRLHAASRGNFFYDANVGAGLPILSTIKSLVRQGDEIIKIDAVLSGTLSYLFNSFDKETRFSDLVHKAQGLGYTEPDPRDDLNGMDVARKLLVIARQAGKSVELDDVQIEKFLPAASFAAPTVDAFYSQLCLQDDALSQLRDQAAFENKKLRYIAQLIDNTLRISLQAVGPEHPFYNLSGNDNCISITTRRYQKRPLVIQGPGAGAEVTAAKVLDGIIQFGVQR